MKEAKEQKRGDKKSFVEALIYFANFRYILGMTYFRVTDLKKWFVGSGVSPKELPNNLSQEVYPYYHATFEGFNSADPTEKVVEIVGELPNLESDPNVDLNRYKRDDIGDGQTTGHIQGGRFKNGEKHGGISWKAPR